MINFDEKFNMKELNEAEKEIEKNGGGDFPEVPHGTYEVHISKAELKASKAGNPMVSIWFKIVDGDFKNSLIFYNQTVHTGFGLHQAKEMLRDLNTSVDIEFDTFETFSQKILDVAEESQEFDYQLNYSEGNNGFSNYKIEESFPALNQ